MILRQIIGRRASTILLALCLAGGLGTAIAQQTIPALPPDVHVGVVDWIDTQNGLIVVDDKQYVLPGSLPSNVSIKAGTEIRFRFKRQEDKKVITEILR